MEPAEPSFVEMGKMGEGTLQVCLVALASGTLPRKPRIICPLEIGTTMTNFSQEIGNMKSRMNREVHVRFCGKAAVKFPCLTRLAAILKK
jgi:hypothetical protein